jgi:hypothetical protein
MTFAIADVNMNAPGEPVLKTPRIDIKNTARRDQLEILVGSTKRSDRPLHQEAKP